MSLLLITIEIFIITFIFECAHKNNQLSTFSYKIKNLYSKSKGGQSTLRNKGPLLTGLWYCFDGTFCRTTNTTNPFPFYQILFTL